MLGSRDTVEQLWAVHLGEPFRDAGREQERPRRPGSTIAGSVSSYLSSGGEAGAGHTENLSTRLVALHKALQHLGYPGVRYHRGFRYLLRFTGSRSSSSVICQSDCRNHGRRLPTGTRPGPAVLQVAVGGLTLEVVLGVSTLLANDADVQVAIFPG